MLKSLLIVLFISIAGVYAGLLITPESAIIQNFGADSVIEKKSILLNNSQSVQVGKQAKTKLSTKLYRAFIIKEAGTVAGYAVLLNETVRSKNAAVLYMIDPSGAIKAVEIVAFNEPPEYMPQEIWINQFSGKTAADELRVGKEIPTITGATMSARNIADGSRVALALYHVVLKP